MSHTAYDDMFGSRSAIPPGGATGPPTKPPAAPPSLAQTTESSLTYLNTYRRSFPATLIAYASDLRRLQEFVAATGLPDSTSHLTARHLQAFAFSLRDAAPSPSGAEGVAFDE